MTRFRRRMLMSGAALVAVATAAAAVPNAYAREDDKLHSIKHIVVIYEENHSFDNLFGGWEGVNGIEQAPASGHVVQVGPNGVPLPCLPQNDVNLASPPLAATCHGAVGGVTVDSAFANQPYVLDSYIGPDDKTCPAPGVFAARGVVKDSAGALPGGCTEDLVHRFYQEQYQIDGGQQDRYVTGSDAIGLVMGRYDTTSLPIYQYLHSAGHPDYAIADNFFQGAFGGSFLNHQWLIAAAAPVWPNAVSDGASTDLHSVVGTDGSPATYPLHPASGSGLKDLALTQAANPDGSCKISSGPTPPPGTVCGDYAVNTIQPFNQPYSPGTADFRRLPPQTGPTIGDRLSAKGVDWAWYSGGWDNAAGNVGGPGWTNGSTTGSCTDPKTLATAVYPNCPDKLFQFHHQPFAYFANYAPGTAARAAHLKDEAEFIAAAQSGNLKPVSFVKPIGEENEHPGYASEHTGSDHLVDLIKAIVNGKDGKDTMIIVTYDEFGGQWDHVSPPRTAGVSDGFGPGTRIPALIISSKLANGFTVDDTQYDTTSILTTIEHRFGLAPLGTRDAAVNDLAAALNKNKHD